MGINFRINLEEESLEGIIIYIFLHSMEEKLETSILL